MFPLNIWQANNGKDIKRIEKDGKLIWNRCVEQTGNPFVGSRDTALRKLETIAAMEQGKWTKPTITVTARSVDTVAKSGDVYTWTGSYYCLVKFEQEIPAGATVHFAHETVAGSEQRMTYCTWQFSDGTEGKTAFDSATTSAVVPEKPVKALYCYKTDAEKKTTQKFRITECAFTLDTVSPATPVSIYGNNGVLGLSKNLFNMNAPLTNLDLLNSDTGATNSYVGIKVTDKAGTYYATAINPNKRDVYYYLADIDPTTREYINPTSVKYFILPSRTTSGSFTLPEGHELWLYNAYVSRKNLDYIEEMDVMITEGPAQVIYEPYGVTQKRETINLFDARRTDETGFFINNGADAEALSSNRTFVFEVKPSTKYSYWHCVGKGGGRCFETAEVAKSGAAAVWTDAKHTYMDPNTVVTITTKADTKYLYVCVGRVESDSPPIEQQKDDFVLIEGEPQSTAYIPFGGEQSEAMVRGLNLLDIAPYVQEKTYSNGSTVRVKADGTITLHKVKGDNVQITLHDAIWEAGKTYTIKVFGTVDKTIGYPHFSGNGYVFDSNGHKTFAASNTQTRAILYSGADFEGDISYKLMLAEGADVPSEYQPYIAPQSAPVVDLYAVGDYKDTYDVVSGKVTRRCGAVMWDGSEKWTKNGTTSYYTSVESRVTGMSCPYICSHSKDLQLFMTYNVGLKVSKLPESVTDVDTLKVWLKAQYDAGTPVIFVFPLKDEVTEQAAANTVVQYRGMTQMAFAVSDYVKLEVTAVSLGEN